MGLMGNVEYSFGLRKVENKSFKEVPKDMVKRFINKVTWSPIDAPDGVRWAEGVNQENFEEFCKRNKIGRIF